MDEITRTLQNVAAQQALACFTPAYVTDTPQEDREIEGLGLALSWWAQWDGLKLMRVFVAALEDANFHEEASEVGRMIAKLEEE